MIFSVYNKRGPICKCNWLEIYKLIYLIYTRDRYNDWEWKSRRDNYNQLVKKSQCCIAIIRVGTCIK